MTLHPTILAMPVAIPLIFGALAMLVQSMRVSQRVQIQQVLTGAGIGVNLLLAVILLVFSLTGGPIAYQMGLWPAPFGITVYLDTLTAIMLTMVGLLSALIFPFALATIDAERTRLGFFPMMLFLLMGANGAFITGDLFNLYVFYEVLLMASFVLLTLGGTPSQINGGIRYVVLNLMGSMMLLLAAGVTYGTLGTLNMAHIAVRMGDTPYQVQAIIAGLLLIAFGAKAAAFPVFFWLPSSYHTPHPVVTALFSGVLTKVGMYSMFRVFPLFFPWLLTAWQPLLMTVAGLTMVIGVLGAFAQPTIRRLLSFHIISQIGYMIMGLGVALAPSAYGAGFGLALAILFLVHNQIIKTALLLGGGAIELEMGTGKLNELGGLVRRKPVQATLFFIAAFSLAGFPPTSGFIGKLGLLEVTFSSGQWAIAGVSVFVSLLTTMSMVRLWQYMFWGKPHRQPLAAQRMTTTNVSLMTTVPVAILVALSLLIGVAAQPALNIAQTAAAQAIDRAGYVQTVNPALTDRDLLIPLGDASQPAKVAGG
ncbi:MAG: proton-conducting transporter membrane subunit [Caldilinea sp.]